MRTLSDTKAAVALAAGLSLTGLLAGCAAATPEPEVAPETETAPQTDTSTPVETDGEATYADGTYEAPGSYQSPNGTESIEVTVTLAGDVITAVEVVGFGESPNSKRFQGEFAGGIGAAVVGKDIDSISVSKIAGSSLTSGGFNAAIATIKAEAAQ